MLSKWVENISKWFERRSKHFERQSKHFERQSKRFKRQSKRFERLSKHFEKQSKHFERQSKRFEKQSKHFEKQSKRFERLSKHFETQNKSFERSCKHFERLNKHSEMKTEYFENIKKYFKRDRQRPEIKVDVLNSKTKKIHIELPDYSFRHSASKSFLGRTKLKDRLANFLTQTSTHKGVYLVTGDRGVGKTSLVEEVIKKTSLSKSFPSWLKFLLLILCAILIVQTVLWEICNILIKWNDCITIVLFLIIISLAYLLGRYSPHKRKCRRYQNSNLIKASLRVIRASAKEFVFIQDVANPFVKQQYFLKMILIVCVVMFLSGITDIAPIKWFIVYLSLLLSFVIKKSTDNIIYNIKPVSKNQKCIYYIVDTVSFFSFPTFTILIICYNKWCYIPIMTFLIFLIYKLMLRINLTILLPRIYDITVRSFIDYLSKYIQSYPRIYIKINFGQEGQSKRDILRLIARSLQTSYFKYCSSLRHMFLWRTTSFAVILLFTFLFYKYIYSNDISSKYTLPVANYAPLSIVDSAVNHIYNGVWHLPQYFWEMESGNCKTPFYISNYRNSHSVNYVFILTFICFYLLTRIILRISPIVTPRKVKRQLKNLNDSIIYNMEKSNNQGISVTKESLNLNGTRGIKKSKTIADEGEIEMELQAIFVAMQKIPLLMCKPEWVIVFDELDKMEPKNIDNDLTKDNILSIHASRDKQAAILKLLSDIKYFLSTSEAQFIFIAGREMYDIYLADISERSNLLGSIFNDVVIVPSFLSEYADKDATSDMTSMVEKYVCTHIIPSFYSKFPRNLKGYKKYLDEIIYDNQTFQSIIEREKERIISCLQHFIFYLAYTSKGAPKKIVQIFESYIQTYDSMSFDDKLHKFEDHNWPNINIKWYRNSCFFLTFDYYDQFMLGMTSYLVAPVMYRFNDSNIQKHSDKLSVSSLRFIDFLFKFHRHNFSWKSLDISPELIEINRAPELKSIAENLTNYFLRTHVDKSYSGLYEYRFDNLISQEISFMSKVCEQFSAMFNFSLDESLVLKNHYKKLLKEAQERTKEKNYNIQHAITSLQIVLGDLHFYDDEFEEAATYYKDGIQSLPAKGKLFTNNESQHVYLYIRNMLKLGFVYEKRKQYDFAFLTYSDLCNDIIKYKIGIQLKDMRLIYLPFLAKLEILEKCHTGGIRRKDIDEIINSFESMTYDMNKDVNILKAVFYARVGDILYYKNYKFDAESLNERHQPCSACFCYQIAISKLLMTQTNSLKQILTDVYLQTPNNTNVKYCQIMAQLLSNWGNVFYACDGCNSEKCRIKNQVQNTITNDQHINNDVYDDDDFWESWINFIKNSESYNNEGFTKILDAERYTKMKLAIIMDSLSIKYYKKANDYKRSAFQITKILQMVSDYVLVFKKCNYEKLKEYINILSSKAIQSLYVAYDGTTLLEINKRRKDFSKTQIEIIPLQTILVDSEIKRIAVIVKSLELTLLKKSYNEITEFRTNLKNYYNLHISSPYGINYSVSARIFRLRLKSTLNWETYKCILSENEYIENESEDTNRYSQILGFYVAILKNGKNDSIDEIFTDYYSGFDSKSTKNVPEFYMMVLEKLISETIFCFKEIIRLSKTVGETFLFNHSLMGDIYYYLADWTMLLDAYLKIILLSEQTVKNKKIPKYENAKWKAALKVIYENDELKQREFLSDLHQLLKHSSIETYMENYLGKEWRENMSGYLDNHNALSHYYKCQETHEEGKAYFDMIDDMYYLKEDFSDRSNHFYIARERYFINSGKLRDRIGTLKKQYDQSKLHKIDSYFQN
jgi:hypothetical protein